MLFFFVLTISFSHHLVFQKNKIIGDPKFGLKAGIDPSKKILLRNLTYVILND